jgi:tetratricopeptide (TPR) repeat protein
VTPPAPPATPLHPEFLYPVVPQDTPASQSVLIESGWRFLQTDNLRNAERAFQDALKGQPQFHPAATGLGYVQLADRDAKSAVTHFERALQAASAYVPALVGRGQALLELNREGEALASFEAALKADPSLTDLKGRVEVLRFRALQDNLARAQAATDAGRLDEARGAYLQAIAASPESAFLYRELGLVERKSGDTNAALEHFRKAVELDASDARAHAQIGAILEEREELEGALDAYDKARALDPAEVPADVVARTRERAALAKLPVEYRAIPASPSITRAELAALLGVRLAPLLSTARSRQVVVTDVRANWAQEWILAVVRAGLMETQPNYTFQPAARVRRGDLANIVSRTLALIAARNPARARVWQDTTPRIADIAPSHLSYPAVSQAVASGVMALENGAFQLLRPVSGADAVAIVSRLEALARP